MGKISATTSGIGVSTAYARCWPAAALVAVAAAVALTAACSTAAPRVTNVSETSSVGATPRGGGRVSPGNSTLPTGGDQGGNAGSFTVEFATCMRSHGVANFPDPDGQGGQLGPDSGIDPTSPAFRSAINGPCKSSAPAAWLSSDSGPDSIPGGGD